MAVHLAILARDTFVVADAINGAVLFMDEGVQLLARLPSHPLFFHPPVAVKVVTTCHIRIHMLPMESFLHGLAIGGLHQPQPQQGQQQEQKQ